MYTLTHTSMGKPSLTNEDIATEVARRLKRYENFNFFERFAMFMGTAQLVEISLKQLLHRKFEIEFERLTEELLIVRQPTFGFGLMD